MLRCNRFGRSLIWILLRHLAILTGDRFVCRRRVLLVVRTKRLVGIISIDVDLKWQRSIFKSVITTI